MKKMLALSMVLALAVAFTAGCKKKEEVKPATPAVVEPAKAPVQAPMSAKAAPKADATKAPEAAKAPEAPKK
jgi:PBP1b-binding outer membrane lipoprotein LpoB